MLKRKWGGRYIVRWVRGHPELRKEKKDWTLEEIGNDWVDRAADVAYRME